MKKITATSSPIRVSKCFGKFFFGICGAIELSNGEIHSGFEATGNTYQEAKENFWKTWKQMYPGVYLSARLSR